MRLETRAIHWLLYQRKCWFAVCERSPRGIIGEPDALGVTPGRMLIEIEIKRSVSDFRANAKKRHIENREVWIKDAPYQYYFLTPKSLTSQVLPLLPEWAGLMSDGWPLLEVAKVAPVNKQSRRLSVKECLKLGRCMANHVAALMVKNDLRMEHYGKQEMRPVAEFEDYPMI